ncbi:MAG: hypothetical protein K6E88_09495 [Lachnospiraceae bacterium]|nr:hypothetical protein [Lachnospiraceae bacterium]
MGDKPPMDDKDMKDMPAVAVLLVGHPKDGTDAVTGATERNPFDDVASFVR